jgi:hypothetical protein
MAALAALAASLIVLPGTLGAQRGTSTVVAGVADAETGQPLEGAEVIMVSLRRLARISRGSEHLNRSSTLTLLKIQVI